MSSQTIKAIYNKQTIVENTNEDTSQDLAMKNLIREFDYFTKPTKFILENNENKSLYSEIRQNAAEEEELKVGDDEFKKLARKIFNSGDPYEFYKDFENMIYLKKESLLDKVFLVEGKLQSLDWKITDLKKTFGDYTAIQAIAMGENNLEITAYFLEDIAISDGPDKYFGLPGLIAEVKIGNSIHITLEELIISDAKVNVKIPEGGKKVSEIEYDEIIKQKLMDRDALLGGF